MVGLDRHSFFAETVDEMETLWNKSLEAGFKAVSARLKQWDVFNPKKFIMPFEGKQTDVYDAMNELLILFEYTINKERLMELYGSYIDRIYQEGVNSTINDGPSMNLAFDTPDFDFLRFMHSQTPTIFSNYFGAIGENLRNTIFQGLGAGESWLQISRRIRDTHNFSRYRSETIVRTEFARAVTEGRLNSYDKNDINMVEWIAERDGTRCSRIPNCASMNGQRFETHKAHGMQPAHPRCRCDWLPVTKMRQDRDDFKEHLITDDVDEDQIISFTTGFLEFPDALREAILTDMRSGQLSMVFTSKEQHHNFWDRDKRGNGYYGNTSIHAIDSHVLDRLGLKLGTGKDVIVNSFSPGWFTPSHILRHEVGHYIDFSLAPRLKGLSISSRNRISNSLKWDGFMINYLNLSDYKQWSPYASRTKNPVEFFAESFLKLFYHPYRCRNILITEMPTLWKEMNSLLALIEG